MWNYFTTYNVLLTIALRHRSRAARALNLCVAVPTGLLAVQVMCTRARVEWKGRAVSRFKFLLLELVVHQLPLALAFSRPASGCAFEAVVPVALYCFTAREIPYRVGPRALGPAHAMSLLAFFCPLVELCTRCF
jgi:hypothetical protein